MEISLTPVHPGYQVSLATKIDSEPPAFHEAGPQKFRVGGRFHAGELVNRSPYSTAT
jgi:hypothetical protein